VKITESITGPIGAGVGGARVSIAVSGVTRVFSNAAGSRLGGCWPLERYAIEFVNAIPGDSLNVGWRPSFVRAGPYHSHFTRA